ncbi:hypothetical protein ACF3M1_16860 [Luteimonas sp. WGS1318]|uniref:hypothetical protein n=1 Tax=Luteimonas sp. WGS1318 TaxID=3366815 RepID=UPI00372D4797
MRGQVRPFVFTLALGVLLVASGASAQSELQAEVIRSEQAQLRSEVIAGEGAFKEIAADRKALLLAEQERVDAMLQGVDRVSELDERRQSELLNALASIQSIVAQAEDERMVCQRSKPIGSNRTQTVCKTVAQRRMEREAAQQDMGRRNLDCSEAAMGLGGCGN